jgi:DNA polymerase I
MKYVLKPNDVISKITVKEFNVANINQIQNKDEALRGKSKPVTFAAQYGGTYLTFMNNSGFSEEEAKSLEVNYNKLYHVSKTWSDNNITLASQQGYLDVAFGLRVRTPILKQVMLNTDKVPREALEEARTVNNAAQQSYGMLNNRAAIDVYKQVVNSKYRLDILPVMHIHDAQYFLVKDDIDVLYYINQALPKAMAWQELPEIQHPEVTLGGEIDIFYPSWAYKVTLPAFAPKEQIISICQKHNKLIKESK